MWRDYAIVITIFRIGISYWYLIYDNTLVHTDINLQSEWLNFCLISYLSLCLISISKMVGLAFHYKFTHKSKLLINVNQFLWNLTQKHIALLNTPALFYQGIFLCFNPVARWSNRHECFWLFPVYCFFRIIVKRSVRIAEAVSIFPAPCPDTVIKPA